MTVHWEGVHANSKASLPIFPIKLLHCHQLCKAGPTSDQNWEFLNHDVIGKVMALKFCFQPLYFIDLATENQSGSNFPCLHR